MMHSGMMEQREGSGFKSVGLRTRHRDTDTMKHRDGDEGTRGHRAKMAFVETSMNLGNFIKRYPLPHSAKVKEGYDGEYDMEFSTGEVLIVYRTVNPLSVTLTLNDPHQGKTDHVRISTVNDDVRFHVVPRFKEPRIFRSVKEIIEAWPLMIRSLISDANTRDFELNPRGRPLYRRRDELKLLRSLVLDDSESHVLLECHLVRTRAIVLLSEHDTGEFVEVEDPQSFTVQELIDLPRATRTLRLDASLKGKSNCGIPSDYAGTLTMNTPNIQVQIARVLEGDLEDSVTLSDPVLVSIDCGITIAPRDEIYRPDHGFLMYTLTEIVEKSSNQIPCVVRIIQAVNNKTVLKLHRVNTSDSLVIFSRKSINRIVSHSGNRYFLIPATHPGVFMSCDSNRKLHLAELTLESLPTKVRYVTKDYVNMIEDLPSDDVIVFDSLIKDDASIVAAKVFDENFGNGFHVSLGTDLKVQKVRWRGKLQEVPARMSPYADCAEEISELRYNEIMESIGKSKQQQSGTYSSAKRSQSPKTDDNSGHLKANSLPGSNSNDDFSRPPLLPRKNSSAQQGATLNRRQPPTP